MDDRELETRLKARLHARFDDAPVPMELASNVHQGLTTAPARVGFDLRSRGRWVGWTAVAAAVVVAIVTVTIGKGILGPATPRNTLAPTPVPTVGAERHFMVLLRSGTPTKPESGLAADILSARLLALGIGNFTAGVGDEIQFRVPADGPSDDVIRAVLAANGNVEFVPVPAGAFASLQPEPGDALPSDLPALFGNEGIVSVERATNPEQGIPVLDITLTSAAATLFGDYTAAHSGDYMAIVVDGMIAVIPVVSEPLRGPKVQVSSGAPAVPGRPDTAFDMAAAILIGGRLPDEWQGARVPGIVTVQYAINAALGQFPGATVESADLTVEGGNDGWLPIWNVVISREDLANQRVPCPTPGASGNNCPTVGPTRIVVVNGEGGGVIRIEIPPA